jgi:hypothetical protein
VGERFLINKNRSIPKKSINDVEVGILLINCNPVADALI